MTEPTGEPPLRIGTSERQSAMKALDVHLDAGRLGVEEYAERSATAANATLASELRGLFTDLPEPHPQLPGPAVVRPPERPLQEPAEPGPLLGSWGPRIVAITPLLAVALFFVTRQWLWFLIIPVAGALVYGADRSRR